MAKTNQGILGPVLGKIGPVSGYLRGNQNILRSSKSDVHYRATPGRIAQQEKMKLCNAFTKPFAGTGFFDKTFPAYGAANNGSNRATSALLNQAVTGTYPGIQLSYPKVLISQGKLPGAENAAAVADKDGNIHFSFTDNSDTGTASGFDKVIAVGYCAALQQAVFTLNAACVKMEKQF
jgi:hypothetical protein